MRVTAIAALAVFLIVAEAPLRELLRAGRYRALRANLKPHAPPLNLSRVLEVAVADRCVGDGRCAGDELHDFAAAKGRMARVQAALNSKTPAKDAQKYMSSENEVELSNAFSHDFHFWSRARVGERRLGRGGAGGGGRRRRGDGRWWLGRRPRRASEF